MTRYSKRVYLRVTNRCNKNCNFCFYINDPKPINDMSVSLLKEIIEKELNNCPENSKLYVEFTGGEPTLYKHLKESLDYLKDNQKLSITMETNCSTLDRPEFLEVLNVFRQKDNYLKLSFNSSLINSDPNWLSRLTDFVKFAKTTGINYRLNIRVADRADQLDLQRIIEENNLYPNKRTALGYYKIKDENLYRDGTLTCTGKSIVIYDFDGSVLVSAE